MGILELNTADIFNAIGGGSPLSIIDSVLHPQYVIRDSKTGDVALEFSGMASIQPSGSAHITTAPVEGGAYQSINKVRNPSVIRCEIIITGLTGFTGQMPNIFDLTLTSQSDALKTIKTMLETASTYDIETPKETFKSFDLVDHSYTVTSQTGVTMLIIYIDFQEVIQQMEVAVSNSQADNKPVYDDVSQGVTGTGSSVKDGASSSATLDFLSKTWGSLKTALGIKTDIDNVTAGFTSALDTVSGSLSATANSTNKKIDELTKNITGNHT